MKYAIQQFSAFVLCMFVSTAVMTFSASSEDEKPLTGNEILVLLSDSRVRGADFEQSFGTPDDFSPASTTYWQGNNASYGKWRVENNQYCSQWQENGPWSCYQVTSQVDDGKTQVVWIDSAGRRYEGVLISR